MKLSAIGEFKFISRVKKKLPRIHKSVIGIGDDCAVVRYTKKSYLLLTQDMLIEGVHFVFKKRNYYNIGRKSLAVSLSDIAAMAGMPRYCLISIGASGSMPVEALDEFYSGVIDLAKEFGVEVVGGDTNRSDKFICDICLVGEVEKKFIVTRSTAKAGDKIFVTGFLGGSIKGRHYNFIPRIKEARALTKNFEVTSMIDISDGLSSDIRHIANASGLGALIYSDKIPISKDAGSLEDALSQGEDFELLFTAGNNVTQDELSGKMRVCVTEIGRIVSKDKGVQIEYPGGLKKRLIPKGYRHF